MSDDAYIKKYDAAVVLGLGDSGYAAARLLLEEGSDVTVLDAGSSARLNERKDFLERSGATVHLNADAVPRKAYDLCVASPGFAKDSKLMIEAKGMCPVISELEFGASRCSARTIAITGTNGKSTMTKFCCDALTAAGYIAEIGGNYGIPVSDVALSGRNPEWLVLEVSSFQLENIRDFSPDVAVLLNIQPDHLDRHGTMDEYRRCKAKIFSRVPEDGVCIAPLDEIDAVRRISCSAGRWLSFGVGGEVDYRYSPGVIESISSGAVGRISITGGYFDNRILGLTGAASAAALDAAGLSENEISQAFSDFVPLPHRMEEFERSEGIRYVDDSKATNLAALAAGIEMAGEGVRLIAGGLLKEKISENVKEVLVKNVASVYLIGKASVELKNAWGHLVACIECGDLENAVRMAAQDSHKGDVVLLSPGCASFDQFDNYKDRGNKFKELVKKET